MIFVITGSQNFQFDRLVKKVDEMKKDGLLDEDVFIQLGSCGYVPTACDFERWLSFDAMRKRISEASLVITHAGAGTALLCLEMGKTPILVTRDKAYGELVDGHQVPFARMMEENGYAISAYRMEDLPSCVAKFREFQAKPKADGGNKARLLAYLEEWLEA